MVIGIFLLWCNVPVSAGLLHYWQETFSTHPISSPHPYGIYPYVHKVHFLCLDMKSNWSFCPSSYMRQCDWTRRIHTLLWLLFDPKALGHFLCLSWQWSQWVCLFTTKFLQASECLCLCFLCVSSTWASTCSLPSQSSWWDGRTRMLQKHALTIYLLGGSPISSTALVVGKTFGLVWCGTLELSAWSQTQGYLGSGI